jgi:photosystem II stability/assembly factor-like uncharacterized protein
MTALLASAGAQTPTCLQSCSAVPGPAHPFQFHKTAGGLSWGAHYWRDTALGRDVLWVGEDGGRIHRSDDGGATWSEQETPRELVGEVQGIFFQPDGQVGYAVTSDGWLIGTSNGGACWKVLQPQFFDPYASSEPDELFDVHFVSATYGWLAGKHRLMHTDDGGCTWQNESIDPSVNLSTAEFYAVDSLLVGSAFVALVAAEPGLVLRRTRTQTTWTTVLRIDPANQANNLPAGLLLDPAPSACGACSPPCSGCPGALEIWDVSIAPSTSISTAVAYACSSLCNGVGYVFRGTAGGTSWQLEKHQCQFGSCAPSTTACPSPKACDVHGYASFAALYSIHAFDADRAIACGYGAQMMRRDANSATAGWIDESDRCSMGTQPLRSAFGDTSNKAWIVGFFGAVRSTIDGGDNWAELRGGNAWRLSDLDFIDSLNGWVIGQQNRIAFTCDGGNTWTQQNAEPWCPAAGAAKNAGSSLRSIAMGDSLNGVAVGPLQCLAGCPDASAGVCFDPTCSTPVNCCGNPSAPAACSPRYPIVLVSTNASVGTCGSSATWTALGPAALPPAAIDQNLNDVACSGNNGVANEYWAVGGAGLVLWSSDGGQTFVDVPITGIASAATAALQGVAFGSLDSGFVVGSYSPSAGTVIGVAYRVTNASNPTTRTWTDLTPSPAVPPFVEVGASGNTAYAVGGTVATGTPSIAAWRPGFSVFAPLSSALALAAGRTLKSVSVLAVTGGYEVFIGGEDGLLLWSPQGSTWSLGDPETGHNVTGLSFLSSSSGFVVAIGDLTDAVVMRYGP